MLEFLAAAAIFASLLIAVVAITRENRYRFADRKLGLYTDLILAAEERYDLIRWQLVDQASAAERQYSAAKAQIREVGPGKPVERARSAIRLATRDATVDAAAERLMVAASDLGQVAYKAAAPNQLVPPPDRDGWIRLEAAYTTAWSAFIDAAKADIEPSLAWPLKRPW